MYDTREPYICLEETFRELSVTEHVIMPSINTAMRQQNMGSALCRRQTLKLIANQNHSDDRETERSHTPMVYEFEIPANIYYFLKLYKRVQQPGWL